MPTPSPTMAPMVGAAVETVRPPASSTMPPRPRPTATSASAIGTRAATTVPKATRRTTSAATRPTASALEDFFSALRNAASPPNSASSPSARAGSRASPSAAAVSRPNSVDGTSRVISAYAIRPSGDTRSVRNGSLTVSTCLIVATCESADATPGRKSVTCWPSGAANTTTAVPPATAGNRSSSSFIASALSLPGALKSSVNAPPRAPERATTSAARTAHAPIVVQGLRALATPMRRMKRFMVCSRFEVWWVIEAGLGWLGCWAGPAPPGRPRPAAGPGRGPSAAGRAAPPGRRPGRAGRWSRRSGG